MVNATGNPAINQVVSSHAPSSCYGAVRGPGLETVSHRSWEHFPTNHNGATAMHIEVTHEHS